MNTQPIRVTDSDIYIESRYFCNKDNTSANKEILADILAKHYRGQDITVLAGDGENHLASGLMTLIAEFCAIFDIDYDKVTFETHDATLTEPFNFRHLPLGLFLSTGRLIPEFERNLVDPKFVGTAIGRFTPTRLRLAYELDQAFPDDTYMVFQGKTWFNGEPFQEIYKTEIEWFRNANFNHDIASPSPIGAVGFDLACANYPNIWNQYQIEAVIETDPVSNFWFTEKTAKCLATGKPFVLINGYRSLARLREMGFFTYGSVIDESYDECYLPTQRIEAVVNSLKTLYNSKDRDAQIQQMYEIARKNQDIYRQYVKDQETTNVQSKI